MPLSAPRADYDKLRAEEAASQRANHPANTDWRSSLYLDDDTGEVRQNAWTAGTNRTAQADPESWKAVPKYANDLALKFYNQTSSNLKDLTTTGYDRISSIYQQALANLAK